MESDPRKLYRFSNRWPTLLFIKCPGSFVKDGPLLFHPLATMLTALMRYSPLTESNRVLCPICISIHLPLSHQLRASLLLSFSFSFFFSFFF